VVQPGPDGPWVVVATETAQRWTRVVVVLGLGVAVALTVLAMMTVRGSPAPPAPVTDIVHTAANSGDGVLAPQPSAPRPTDVPRDLP
jgi:hypothetical protein